MRSFHALTTHKKVHTGSYKCYTDRHKPSSSAETAVLWVHLVRSWPAARLEPHSPTGLTRSLRRETTDSGRPVENQKHFNLIGPQPCYVEARELAGQRNSAVSCSITVGCCWMKRKTEKNRHCHVNSGIDLFHKQTKLKWEPCFMAQCREHCCSKVARSKILSEWFVESSVI